jgi:pilus assembly protein CpaE
MAKTLELCLLSEKDETGEEIRRALGQLQHLKVACDSDNWEQVHNAIQSKGADLLIINLEPHEDHALEVVEYVAHTSPDVGIIGISRSPDPSTIIKAMRAGCAQFVLSPVEPADLQNAITRVQSTRVHSALPSRRICVVGATGGVGATTIACNLALELAAVSHSPSAMVDLNLEFGDVGCAFDCKPKYTVADICNNGADIDPTMVESVMHALPCNVHVLCRPEKVEDAHNVAPEGVERLLDQLGEMYRNVIIDMPRGLNFFSSSAVSGADIILVVTQLTVPSVRNTGRILDLIKRMGADARKVELVLNRWKAEHGRVTEADIAKQFDRPVFGKIPNDYRRVMASLDLGQPIQAEAPNSPARVGIHDLAVKIAGQGDAPPQEAANKAGLLGRFLKKKATVR